MRISCSHWTLHDRLKLWEKRASQNWKDGWDGGDGGMESTDYEDCSQKSGDYRGLPYSTGYTLLKLQRVIPSSGKTCLR